MGEGYSKNQSRIDPRVYSLIASQPPQNTERDKRPANVIIKESNDKFSESMPILIGNPPPDSDPGVLQTIKGIDGNDLNIKIFRPPTSRVEHLNKIPAIVYFHGGGMAIMTMKEYDSYYRRISYFGLIVIGVDFRNSTEKPFPAGLHDCLSAVLWTAEHAKELNIDTDHLVVGGESGGGNLATATCLLAKSRGISIIKGQFLHCPYLSPDDRYESRHKFLFPGNSYLLAQSYTPEKFDDYLAWPCNATVEQLRGLPPAFVIVNDYDFLVDEGEEYTAKLMQAGVRVIGFRSLGTIHGSLITHSLVPDLTDLTIEMLVAWIKSLGKKSKL